MAAAAPLCGAVSFRTPLSIVPVIFSGATGMQTLPVGLTSIMAKHGTNYGIVFAAMTISALPIVIVFFAAQRYFIRGLSEGIGK